MLSLSMASLWHWPQRPDHTLENLSVAYGQVSRVLGLLGQPGLVMEHGRKSLQAFKEGYLPAFLPRILTNL